jgi:hypothetical protein
MNNVRGGTSKNQSDIYFYKDQIKNLCKFPTTIFHHEQCSVGVLFFVIFFVINFSKQLSIPTNQFDTTINKMRKFSYN